MVAVVALRVRCEPYRRHRPRDSSGAEYTCGMNLGKSLMSLATAPARVGLAAADAGVGIATSALGIAHRSLGEAGMVPGSNPVAHMLGIEDALGRANRLARLLDDDAPLGRAIAPDGPIDRLLRPGGVVDMLTSDGGLLDRLTAEGGG
ncbi:MAG: hypothetical protein QOH94_343, partial [Mycobacterium sp.]|nr:hypothetical protein [Mycobacterium sp.]